MSAGSRTCRAIVGLLVTVMLSGCAGASELPSALYDRTVTYFDRWAEQREEPQRQIASGLRDYAPEPGATAAVRPVRVQLPAVGIASDLERLGLDDDGTIQTPRDWQRAGWFRGGPRPGEVGAAVILGHVDSTDGPAVFYRLRELAPGDEIRVTRDDGSVAVFTVDRVEQHRKTQFPTDDVYFPTPEATLRLVTCGGAFDTQARSYVDNLVVFANLDRIEA